MARDYGAEDNAGTEGNDHDIEDFGSSDVAPQSTEQVGNNDDRFAETQAFSFEAEHGSLSAAEVDPFQDPFQVQIYVTPDNENDRNSDNVNQDDEANDEEEHVTSRQADSDLDSSLNTNNWVEREIVGIATGCFDPENIAHRFLTILETRLFLTTLMSTFYVTAAQMQTVSFASHPEACLPSNIQEIFPTRCI